MDFELSEEQEDVKKAAREFAQGEFDNDKASELELRLEFPTEVWKKACRLGFIGIHIPEEYGGQGLGFLENVLVAEEFCRRDSRIGGALGFADLGTEILKRHGSEEQKKLYLVPVVRGEYLSTVAFDEPETFPTEGVEQGKDVLIHGVKRFVLNGGTAGYYLVPFQMHGKTSIILIEKNRKSIEFIPQEKMGMKMVSTGELRFKDVSVPMDHLIGGEGKGFSILEDFLSETHLRFAAQGLGIAQGAFDRGLDYAKQREQFSRKLVQFQIIRHRLAEMATRIEIVRLFIYKVAWVVDRGRMDPKLCAMARVSAGDLVVEIVDGVLQIFGGYGYMTETEIEHFYRDAWLVDIYGGKSNLKDSIARWVIG
jgi:alkylation response protein AidB-like acyl-CoA dehydrogenase